MKKLFFVFFAAIFAFSCSNAPKGDKVETQEAKEVKKEASVEAETMSLKLDSCSIAWVGTKPSGQHNGTVGFKSGELKVKDGELVGGSFVTDMPSITVLDLEEGDEWHTKLLNHLKDKDFFDVDSFPTGSFEITAVEKVQNATEKDGIVPTHKITGNLMLKDVTKSITFDAKVDVKDGMVMAKTGNIVLDRTEWGIKYKSKKFFSELKDKFINDEFSIAISLEAAR
ncbi:MAG: YceI family protein [Okeania sp. SIO3C4]|nr:YceI family protein [Okeania sp. SIO3C4]